MIKQQEYYRTYKGVKIFSSPEYKKWLLEEGNDHWANQVRDSVKTFIDNGCKPLGAWCKLTEHRAVVQSKNGWVIGLYSKETPRGLNETVYLYHVYDGGIPVLFEDESITKKPMLIWYGHETIHITDLDCNEYLKIHTR